MTLLHCIVEYLSHHSTYKQISVATLGEFIQLENIPNAVLAVQNVKFRIMIRVGFSYIKKYSW